MAKDNRSFFEKLTGAIKIPEDDGDEEFDDIPLDTPSNGKKLSPSNRTATTGSVAQWMNEEDEPEEGELTVDVYQSGNEIIIKTMVAGVRPEDLDITITRDLVTIKGKRESEKTIAEEDYFHQELYWGTFSRSIVLPAEVEVEEADAVEKHGLLIIKLPKMDRNKQARLKVKG